MVNSHAEFEGNEYLDIFNVRIRPASLQFKNAFEGRAYKAKLSIQNIGKTKVLVKIDTPTSYAFEIKIMKRPQELSPGLSIVRTVKYTFSHANVTRCQIPILINDKSFDYLIQVELSTAIISISPDVVDFGIVDTGCMSALRVLRLKNEGTRLSKFSIDLPKGRPQFIVEPMKGQILPNTTIDVNIKLISSETGAFNTEMWVKCDVPKRVPLLGEVILSSFESIYPTATESFTVLDFPLTYIGVRTTTNLLVRNFSSQCNMFCVMGEMKKDVLSLEKCRSMCFCFKYFNVFPTDGRFEPDETKLFRFVFSPKKRRRMEKELNYYLCTFLICQVRCQDLVATKYKGGIFQTAHASQSSMTTRTATSASSIRDIFPVMEYPLLAHSTSEYDLRPRVMQFEHRYLKIYVHGMAEEPSVVVIPTELVLHNLALGAKQTRVLEFKNNSSRLPIILHYNKVAFIDIDKENVFLQPSAAVQLEVYITPYQHGHVFSKMSFNLMYFDHPKEKEDTYTIIGHIDIPVTFETFTVTKYPKPELNLGLDPNYLKSVGIFCDGVKFSTELATAKCVTVDKEPHGPKDDLIAFPNDTQLSIRPWRSNLICRTLFTHEPRYVAPLDCDYEVCITDIEFKRELGNFYTNFLRTEAERLRQMAIKHFDPVTDYALTIGSKLLCESKRQNFQCGFKIKPGSQSFIPLTPDQMNNIVVSPTFIDTGRIAANHCVDFSIGIINKNPFPIRIFLKPDKISIIFHKGNRREIAAHSEYAVLATYLSDNVGYYILSLDLIVNECMSTTVTILANVVPSVLSLPITEIEYSADLTYHFVDMTNNLNVPIAFEWEYSVDNFIIHPRRGYIPENCITTCLVRNLPYEEGPMITDMDLRSDDSNCQTLRLISQITPTNVALETKFILFENIALNQPVVRTMMVHNYHPFAVGYQVLDCGLGDIALVAPSCGTLPPYSQSAILIRIVMTHCVRFKCNFRVRITNFDVLEIPLEGNVVYPAIKVDPKVLQFKRMFASTTEYVTFNITNVSASFVTVKFDMTELQDYRISFAPNFWEPPITTDVMFDVKEKKKFYLHFYPLDMNAATFYLPIIINGMIGPPIYTDPVTTKVDYYLQTSPPYSEVIRLPNSIVCIKVIALAREPKIKLSKNVFNFIHFPQLPRLAKHTDKLVLKNMQTHVDEVCLMTDHITYPLYLEDIEAKNIKYMEKAVLITLAPKEQAVLHFLFQPHSFCTIQTFIPIYVGSDHSMDCHTTVYLTGEFKMPTIMGEKTIFYCRPYPLHYTAISSKVIKFKNHFLGCKVSTYTDLPELSMQINHDTYKKISETEFELECVFKTKFSSNVQFINIIKLYCTCGAVWQSSVIGCAENSIMTNYAFADTFLPSDLEHNQSCQYANMPKQSMMSMLDDVSRRIFIEEQYHTSSFFTSYPFFPFDGTFDGYGMEDESLTHFLLTVVEAAEMWFYNQAMFGKVYYVIPNGINIIRFEKSVDSKDHRNTLLDTIPLLQGLYNIMGDRVKEILPTSPKPDDPIERTRYIYLIYKRVISFLKDLGAFFTYMQPEFLMEYSTFEIYKKHVYPDQAVKSPITPKVNSVPLFYSIAKQSWCDLLLQTYKVLCLFRINQQTVSKSSVSTIRLSPLAKYKLSVKDFSKNNNVFSHPALILINWLEFHFNAMKVEIWEGDCFHTKEVNFFGKDLRDGLVFAAVTATYCPYLQNKFESMYVDPVSSDQFYHNNNTLVKCWDMLNYSFKITPEELLQPNCIKMVMLVVYLYDVLPFMHPTDEIVFNAGLSCSTSANIDIRNTNPFPIAYKSIFFDNFDGVFTASDHILIIPPKKTSSITITYKAKFIRNSKAFLLLSGECKGYHYAKNKCLTLIGNPNLTHPTSTFKLAFPLSTFRQFPLNIKSPYKEEATYMMKMLPENEEITCVQIENCKFSYERGMLNRLDISNKYCITDENGLGDLQMLVVTIFFFEYVEYLYFLNETVGDFMVKIHSAPKPPKERESIVAVVPKIISSEDSMLKGVFVEIPKQNTMMWCAILTAMQRRMQGDELIFWRKHGQSMLGMHLLQNMLQETNARIPPHIHCCKKTYKIILLDQKNDISLPKEVSLGDECSPGVERIPVTFLPQCTTIPKRFSFKLVSLDGSCRRYYIVRITQAEHR